MNPSPHPLPYTTGPISEKLRTVLPALQPGQKIRITQLIRVGLKTWPATVTGTFRHVDSLATGLATQRLPQDDILVAVVHFTKDNGEMSSVTMDEHTKIDIL